MRWDEIIDPRLRAYRRSRFGPGGPVLSEPPGGLKGLAEKFAVIPPSEGLEVHWDETPMIKAMYEGSLISAETCVGRWGWTQTLRSDGYAQPRCCFVCSDG